MRQFTVNKKFSGIGDCRFAVGHFTQGLEITELEAADITWRILRKFEKDFYSWPCLDFVDKLHASGSSNGKTGYIFLKKPEGMTVGVLIHELAHLTKHAVYDKSIAIRQVVEALSEDEKSELWENSEKQKEFGRKNRKNLNGHGRGFKKFQLKFLKYFVSDLIKKYEIIFDGRNIRW